MLVIFIFLQRYVVQGLTMGGVKGWAPSRRLLSWGQIVSLQSADLRQQHRNILLPTSLGTCASSPPRFASPVFFTFSWLKRRPLAVQASWPHPGSLSPRALRPRDEALSVAP